MARLTAELFFYLQIYFLTFVIFGDKVLFSCSVVTLWHKHKH
jgi:hypothetical protein